VSTLASVGPKGPPPKSTAAIATDDEDLELGLLELMAETRAAARGALARAQEALRQLDGCIDPGVVGPHLASCGRTGGQLTQVYAQCFRLLARHRREGAA